MIDIWLRKHVRNSRRSRITELHKHWNIIRVYNRGAKAPQTDMWSQAMRACSIGWIDWADDVLVEDWDKRTTPGNGPGVVEFAQNNTLTCKTCNEILETQIVRWSR